MATDSKRQRPGGRRWEVDALRGLAVVAMVVSNFLFDLGFFLGLEQFAPRGPVAWFARGTAATFLLLAGVSLTLRRQCRGPRPLPALLRRVAMLLGAGMVVSLATWLAVGQQLVVFGILHCIAVATLLARPVEGRPLAAFLIGLVLLAAGPRLAAVHPPWPWLLPLGLAPWGFHSVDYVPLAPWAGFVFLGMALAAYLYRDGACRLKIPAAPGPAGRTLAFLGRRSLAIYFLHQPMLLALLWAGTRLHVLHAG